jgi:hypothetical protein
MHKGYWWGSQNVRGHWEDLDVGVKRKGKVLSSTGLGGP